jgi:hypothetical protein
VETAILKNHQGFHDVCVCFPWVQADLFLVTQMSDKRLFQQDWAWPTPKWRNGWQFPLANLQVSQTAAARCFEKCGGIWHRAGVNKQFRYKLSSVHIRGCWNRGSLNSVSQTFRRIRLQNSGWKPRSSNTALRKCLEIWLVVRGEGRQT